MLVTVLFLCIGLALIIKGGDVFVDAASWVAEKTGIPKLIVGATIVSVATTLPELLVSLLAAAGGKVDMAIGNAVGSVTVNTGLVMGVAIVCMPAVVQRKEYLVKSILMLGAAAVLVCCGFLGSVSFLASAVLLVIFAIFLWHNVREATLAMKLQPQDEQKQPTTKKTVAINIAKFVGGALAIVVGSQLLVDNGTILAAALGVPERVIAVSIVAIGTSLPELVTTITAIAKKQSALSVGNILGANILDLTMILPFSSLVAGKPLPISAQFATLDLPACLLIGCLALLPMLLTKRFRRAQGVCMIVAYMGYLTYTTLFLG